MTRRGRARPASGTVTACPQVDEEPEVELAAVDGVPAAGVGLEVEVLDVVSLPPVVLVVPAVSDVDVLDESVDVAEDEVLEDEREREALASARASVR